jgi:hypothetical protein
MKKRAIADIGLSRQCGTTVALSRLPHGDGAASDGSGRCRRTIHGQDRIPRCAKDDAMAEPLMSEWRRDPQAPRDLVELRDHIDQLPLHLRDKLVTLCDRVGHYARLQTRLIRIAQDAVDQLQLDVKYLSFDLEATRRERDELFQQLQEIGGGDEE